jgi:signal peptidase II
MQAPNVTLTSKQQKAKRYTIFGLIIMILASVGLDQASKVDAEATLMTYSDPEDVKLYAGRRYPIWSHNFPFSPENDQNGIYFGFNYVRNTGAAWGFLGDLPKSIRVPFFYTVTTVAVIVILMFFHSTPLSHRLARFSLGLIFSGAIGNFIDRLRLGYVIDWIDVRWSVFGWSYNFPNFNVAESAISVGVFFLLIDMLFLESYRKKKLSAEKAAQAPAVAEG